MKRLLVFVLLLALLAGCQSQPVYTDNGNPGQIKAVVFYDDNKNGVMDSGESGIQTQASISQDVSCPPQNQQSYIIIDTDANGVGLFEELAPGKYCAGLGPNANYSMTTRMNQEVYVSSDLVTTVMFGIVRE